MFNFNEKINMTSIKNEGSPAIRLILLLLLGLSVSCSTVFFDHPQPTDSRNMKSVPGKIQGTWKNVKKDHVESITISKTSYTKITIEKNRIPKALAETSKKYKIENDNIYLTPDDSETGYPYEIIHDTIYFEQRSKEEIVLSDSVLLRAAKNCYILNLKKQNWWEIVFIQKMKNGEIQISYPLPDTFMSLKDQFNITVLDSTRKDTTYFHADFKSKGIEKVIPADGSGMLYLLKPDSTFTTPD
jgi:hypothetical protein